ncbi:2-succinyl-5-enolpyruvyl-6-hydroxy-3-cyclohexene-1-carboxylic-acid synthase [Rhodoblastus sp.]|uniref:2-succinyl-5-enolpyruvyl-6-hydroxy-3- cyclohexene-1-carboxylic-acid synthase n=1 Tax=Rhodoblastus sp. TaxID=1962975 RepID=UPI002621EAA5|nr:2-succinyl-5-enolpyruvyl-6-hydroxy-3-cyclohexene-1-carboxylic-acid synthase [Rhodoblastus sp.]
MTGEAERGFRWAYALLDGLAAAGLRRVVASPGSRSTPLTLAALRHPDLAVNMIVDERSAGFFALGLAKAEGRAAALIATSGSAIANWGPAVVEADMGRIPLILLSADRPPELQDCGANQTMDQIKLFGGHVRAFHQMPPPEANLSWLANFAARLMAESRAAPAGPVHVNLPLREPLTPLGATENRPSIVGPVVSRGSRRAEEATIEELGALLTGKGALVCGPEDLGPDFRRAAVSLAERLGAPIFADVASGLRFGAGRWESILAFPDQVARAAPDFDWVLRFGGAPVSRAIGDWLFRARSAVQMVVSDHGRFADPWRNATHLIDADPADLCRRLGGAAAPSFWLGLFAFLDRSADCAAEAACSGEKPFEGAVLRRLLRQLPEGTPLFLANSLTIRAAEWFVGRTPAAPRCFAARGLSGIDGNLSTAFGLAAALGPGVAAVGDLAFLHDLNALALARQEIPLVILLFDNNGGGVFGHLPQAALPEFEQGWLTPPGCDPAQAAGAFGLPCRRVESVEEAAAAALGFLAAGEAAVVHVPIDPVYSLERCRCFFAASGKES